MPTYFIVIITVLYTSLLFGIAWFAERRSEAGKESRVNNAYVYALSLAVYCTAWAFFGSVGKAAQSGLDFLPIFLGPTLAAVLWWLVLRKMLFISKSQRITSIADFISSRYGKSTTLGILATFVSILAVIPYISIQLKAIAVSYKILTIGAGAGFDPYYFRNIPFYQDPAWYIAILLAVFTIFFGTRKLDPNERHEGLVAAVAFESLFKLVAFTVVGLYVTYGLFNGFGDIFAQASATGEYAQVLFPLDNSINGTSWFWLIVLSIFAVLFLPRQFHLAVVENTDYRHLKKAAWVFPLYLLLINIFVLPIALGGLLKFGTAVSPDTFVLSIPLSEHNYFIAIFAAVGGSAAATGMVMVAVTALSIMLSNNLVVPSLLRTATMRESQVADVGTRLLRIRQLSVVVILIIAYGYFKFVSTKYSLVSIGLISFAGIAQFAPVVLGGMYWKKGTRTGAKAGLVTGTIVWLYCLPLPTLVEAEILSPTLINEGLLGISALRPYSLFGLEGWDKISHGAFWSLLFNTLAYFVVSINTTQNATEILQADIFVNIDKYLEAGADYEVMRRRAKVADIRNLLSGFLGKKRTLQLLSLYEEQTGQNLRNTTLAREDLVNLTETNLAGAIGAASAQVVINKIIKEDPLSLEEMFKILDKTREMMQYSKRLEQKSAQLEATTESLRSANLRLKELDRLKADFITTVTHELRTPITSIKALTKILADNPSLDEGRKAEYLSIVVNESERITRLVNQVLDYEKLNNTASYRDTIPLDFGSVINIAYKNLEALIDEQDICCTMDLPAESLIVRGEKDKLIQAVTNILSNAIKFTDTEQGIIRINLTEEEGRAILSIQDNGKGVAPDNQKLIFEQFAQVTDRNLGKPKGTGLGLPITKRIVERHRGAISVTNVNSGGAMFIVSLPIIEEE